MNQFLRAPTGGWGHCKFLRKFTKIFATWCCLCKYAQFIISSLCSQYYPPFEACSLLSHSSFLSSSSLYISFVCITLNESALSILNSIHVVYSDRFSDLYKQEGMLLPQFFFFIDRHLALIFFIISFCIQYLYVNLGHRSPRVMS